MSRTITLFVLTDGRKEYIEQTIPSALSMLKGEISKYYMFDDSGDPEYRKWLRSNFPQFQILYDSKRLGHAGAMITAWTYMKRVETDYIFHLEDDFLFNEPVPLDEMIDVLEDHPYLYEISLMRQPWWPFEVEAGGVIQVLPEAFTQKERWIEHRRYFSTNPCLYRKSLMNIGWTNCENSERIFCNKIIDNDPNAQFGIWGQKDDKPKVFHIGNLRMGIQY